MLSTRTTAVSVALTVTAAALAGCQPDTTASAQPATAPATSAAPADNGVTALSADQILQRAKDALQRAKSFRATGTVITEGDKTGVDFEMNGADSATSLTTGPMKMELLAVGGQKYMRGNQQFWVMTMGAKQGKLVAKAYGDRWIAGADADQSFQDLFAMGSVDRILDPGGAVSKGEQKEIGGVPTIGLKTTEQPDQELYIATTGEPYPIELAGKDTALTFSDFGVPVTDIQAPAADKVIDLGKLTGK